MSVDTKKQHLAALRKFLDQLVVRHVIVLNPASSVRAERHSVSEGKTPMIPIEQYRALLASIDVTTVAGLRDRAVMAFTAARSGAVARLRVEDFYHDGTQWLLRFREKNGKDRPVPVRHDLEQWLRTYADAAGVDPGQKGRPLFRALDSARRMSGRPLGYVTVWHLVKQRLAAAELPKQFPPHSFRVKVATDLRTQGVPLDEVQSYACQRVGVPASDLVHVTVRSAQYNAQHPRSPSYFCSLYDSTYVFHPEGCSPGRPGHGLIS